ncbi:unnamed protein product [Dibothriocephalus latus]|uniref:Ig-like domain-containing protein n=1 Tax=Dibothriocephalus latus TaxID=60516 RepID=A0A3P7NTJ3_DIBLA|nr:unnamed protein product [Dibothriocephalus latus]
MYQSDEPWRQDDRTRLHCNVSGEADSIVWLKDGIPVANSSRVNIRDNGASLVISMAKAIDTGLYQCIAANPVGEDLGELRLIIDSKPVLVKSPQNQTARLGEIVTMECQAEGHPIPTIRWFHDNSSVRLGGSHSLIRNGSLRIVGVTEKEEGIYHCVASSSQGEAISAPAELKIQIPGGWSDWLPWQACSVACGRGIQARFEPVNAKIVRWTAVGESGDPGRTALVAAEVVFVDDSVVVTTRSHSLVENRVVLRKQQRKPPNVTRILAQLSTSAFISGSIIISEMKLMVRLHGTPVSTVLTKRTVGLSSDTPADRSMDNFSAVSQRTFWGSRTPCSLEVVF